MKCPLFAISSKEQEQRGFLTHIDCLKEECAWWDKLCQSCSVYEISRSLMGIFDVLVDIKENMPQDERTRERP